MKEARLLEPFDIPFGAGIANKMFFNVAESTEKLFVYLPDILLVETDRYDCRNKMVYIKNEERAYTLMNVPFQKLHTDTGSLIKVNKFTLVSTGAIHSYRHDFITLKNIFTGWHNKQVILNRSYRKDFYNRLEKQTH